MDIKEMTRSGTSLLPGQKAPKANRYHHASDRRDFFGHYCIIGGGYEDGDGEIDITGDGAEDEINATHPYTVVAIRMSMLLSLTRTDFYEAKELFPDIAMKLAQNSKQSNDPRSPS